MFLQILLLTALLHLGDSQSQCVTEIRSFRAELGPQIRKDVQGLVEDKATKSDIQALEQNLNAGQILMDALVSNVTKLIQELTNNDKNNQTGSDGDQKCMKRDEVQAMIRSEVQTTIRSEVKDIIQTEVQAIVRAEIQSLSSYLAEIQHNSTALLQEILEPNTSLQLVPEIELHQPGSKYNPVQSCKNIPRESPSGYYWIQPNCGPATEQYCDMISRRCCGSEDGWMRIANWNMSDIHQQCPPGFGLVSYPRRTCGRQSHGCSSVTFPVYGIEYSRVCGKIIGYQYGNSQAFHAYAGRYQPTIDKGYVDGVSLTYGHSPRKHIWTFVGAHGEKTGPSFTLCHCSRPYFERRPDTPGFIERDYFCETGRHDNITEFKFYTEDPLWDGQGCGEESTCCHHPVYFCKQLLEPISEDIELRLCGLGHYTYADTPLEIVEIYVQ